MNARSLVQGITIASLLILPSGRRGVAQRTRATDSADVAAARSAFHKALATGDTTGALQLLSPTVRILESGSIETLAQYRGQHLPADVAYSKSVVSTPVAVDVTVAGDVAWVVASSATTGEFNGRPVNSVTVELMVLRRAGKGNGGWLIESVHWSSRRRTS